LRRQKVCAQVTCGSTQGAGFIRLLGILLYTSVRTTGPTSNRSATASKEACGVNRSAVKVKIGREKDAHCVRNKQNQGNLLLTSVRTTGPTSNRSLIASKEACGANRCVQGDKPQGTGCYVGAKPSLR
jgi:hypothetical protein